MRKQTVVLTAWLALPIVTFTGLAVWIYSTLEFEKPMADAPAVGQGAGETGGANAVGEILGSGVERYIDDRTGEAEGEYDRERSGTVPAHQLGRGLDLAVTDATGTARPGSPLRVRLNDTEPIEMFLSQNGAWTLSLTAEQLEPFATGPLVFTFETTDGGTVRASADAAPAPLVNPASLQPGERPRFEFTVSVWSATGG